MSLPWSPGYRCSTRAARYRGPILPTAEDASREKDEPHDAGEPRKARVADTRGEQDDAVEDEAYRTVDQPRDERGLDAPQGRARPQAGPHALEERVDRGQKRAEPPAGAPVLATGGVSGHGRLLVTASSPRAGRAQPTLAGGQRLKPERRRRAPPRLLRYRSSLFSGALPLSICSSRARSASTPALAPAPAFLSSSCASSLVGTSRISKPSEGISLSRRLER